jgi:redox-sensitive bicupin YhaK (pirin superfamily)
LFGEWEGTEGAFEGNFPITMSTIYLEKGGKFKKSISAEENIFFYLVRGTLIVNGEEVNFRNLVEFENHDGSISIEASEEAILILGHAAPFNEPMVAQGPFVMNTTKQIQEAYADYQAGKFGTWNH